MKPLIFILRSFAARYVGHFETQLLTTRPWLTLVCNIKFYEQSNSELSKGMFWYYLGARYVKCFVIEFMYISFNQMITKLFSLGVIEFLMTPWNYLGHNMRRKSVMILESHEIV